MRGCFRRVRFSSSLSGDINNHFWDAGLFPNGSLLRAHGSNPGKISFFFWLRGFKLTIHSNIFTPESPFCQCKRCIIPLCSQDAKYVTIDTDGLYNLLRADGVKLDYQKIELSQPDDKNRSMTKEEAMWRSVFKLNNVIKTDNFDKVLPKHFRGCATVRLLFSFLLLREVS